MAADLPAADITSIYAPLDEQLCQIRVLTFDGTGEGNIPRFTISVISLDQSPQFNALSYEWGNTAAVHDVAINGHVVSVRPNLYNFMRSVIASGLRSRLPIFIDAICINQDDLTERASQVALMRRVYLEASEVLGWLGLMPYAWKKLADEKEFARILRHYTRATNPNSLQLRNLRTDKYDLYCGFQAGKAAYWTRLWIVQECLLAERLTFYIGSRQVSIDCIFAWSVAFHSRNDRFAGDQLPMNLETVSGFARPGPILSRRSSIRDDRGNRPYYLYQAIITFSIQLCQLPHDGVFGLLGIAKSHIVPDYRISLFQLYLHVWIKGLLDLNEVVGDSLKEYYQLLERFHVACMRIFNMSGLNIAVQIAYHSSAQAHMKLPPINLRNNAITALPLAGSKDSRYWSKIVRAYTIVVQVRGFILSYCIPGGRQLELALSRMLQQWSSIAQAFLLLLLQKMNCAISMPDGATRSYSEWEEEIRRVSELVKRRIPPSPDRPKFSATDRKWWQLSVNSNCGIWLDGALTAFVYLLLVYLGATASAELESGEWFLVGPSLIFFSYLLTFMPFLDER